MSKGTGAGQYIFIGQSICEPIFLANLRVQRQGLGLQLASFVPKDLVTGRRSKVAVDRSGSADWFPFRCFCMGTFFS